MKLINSKLKGVKLPSLRALTKAKQSAICKFKFLNKILLILDYFRLRLRNDNTFYCHCEDKVRSNPH